MGGRGGGGGWKGVMTWRGKVGVREGGGGWRRGGGCSERGNNT